MIKYLDSLSIRLKKKQNQKTLVNKESIADALKKRKKFTTETLKI